MLTLIILAFIFLLSLYFLITNHSSSQTKLPPGSTGLPFIGGTVGFLKSLSSNTIEEWAGRQIGRYGPVSRHNLFGTPTVLVTGSAGNKFLFTNDALVPKQLKPVARLIGEKNLIQLAGDEHRRVRGAVVQSLRVAALKKYVAKIDEEVRHHIENNWTGRKSVQVMPLAKNFSLDNSLSTLFGIEHGAFRNEMKKEFVSVISGIKLGALGEFVLKITGIWNASRRLRNGLSTIVQERRSALEGGVGYPNEDLVTSLLSLGSNDASQALTDDEIIDNAMLLLIAGYDPSSILITYLIYHLANNQDVLDEVTQEQEEIANSKSSRSEPLTWEDVQKMKYTGQVLMETLRMVPPLFGSLRKVLDDVEYNGYHIPKGWHVLWVANVTQMDASIFPDPEKFNPARFENRAATPPYSFVSFGAGPRSCPGMEFAKLQTLVLMHYLVTGFKWKLSSPKEPSPMKGLAIDLEAKY